MHFISTRGSDIGSYQDVIVEGLAPDGGLAVPDQIPAVSPETLESWRSKSYAELAAEVIGLFATDVPPEDLLKICRAAYTPAKFVDEKIVPLTELYGGLSLVGTSEGPTLAFKDMAMQFLGEMLDYVLTSRNEVLNVLGATSGDTGSSAEYAVQGRSRLAAFMLSPQGRMTDFQRAQMYSLQDENIHNIAVEGVFDNCQDLVKELSEDSNFKQAEHLGAMNSINFGRISAQIVYYFWAWLRITDQVEQSQRTDFSVSFAVPSGNFGNILSGYYAKQMGLPVDKLVLASNENNVLDEFFSTGIYTPRSVEDTLATSSPSMDVSKASNLERFIFDFLGRDASRVVQAWQDLATDGFFDFSDQASRFLDEFGIQSGTSTHQDRLDTMRSVYDKTHIIIDPHTADGVHVAEPLVQPSVPMFVLETAKPEKFSETVTEALGFAPELSPEQQELLRKPQKVTEIPADSGVLRTYIQDHALKS